ncbi:I78 family peptidase inhibitor [Pseudomonas sp. nanlin1]|uniref:I78 family peptidase inhibitor n=1 Tax=Pseudomonas sp. nanlin1 TaxID=3040605 RepID=UPI00388F8AC4
MKISSQEEARELAEALIGQTFSKAVREDLASRTGWVVRAKLEGMISTMDYVEQRINLELDDNSTINSVTLG